MTSDSANQRFSNIQILPSVDKKAITNLTKYLEQNGNYFFFFRYFFMQNLTNSLKLQGLVQI